MLLVDSHCHLNFPNFKDDLDQVVQRARENGVGVMQTICTELAEFDEVHGIAQRYDNIYCSVGVHPNEAANAPLASVDEILQRAKLAKVIGIGETGLDYHYETSPREVQQKSFAVHITAAQESGLPLIVHTRDADEDTVNMLGDAMKNKAFKGLIHCFTSTRYLAEKSVDMGLYVSISGIVSFKNAKDIQDTVKVLPLERLLVETDAPYLAPVPHRGKRNEPAFVRNTNKFVAELKQISEEECAAVTTRNFFALFDKAVIPKTA